MQSETGFPSSRHQLKYYVASKSRLKLAARCPVSGCWPSSMLCYRVLLTFYSVILQYTAVRSLDRQSVISLSSCQSDMQSKFLRAAPKFVLKQSNCLHRPNIFVHVETSYFDGF